MNILIINDTGNTHGGAENIIIQLKKNLPLRRHKLLIVSGSEKKDHAFSDCVYPTYNSATIRQKILYIVNPFAYFRIKKTLIDFKPDIIHLHNVTKASPLLLHLCKKYPTIATMHDFEWLDQTRFDDFPSLRPFKESMAHYFKYNKSISYYVQRMRYKFIRLGQRNVDIFVCPSQAMAKLLKESAIKSKVVVVPNGIEAETKRYSATNTVNPKQLLFVGRLVPEKGLDTLLAALQLAKDTQICLDIIGDGPERTILEQLVSDLGLDHRVYFAGYLTEPEMAPYYKKAAIVVIPSVWYEPFGLVALEAMLRGKAVIASKSGGLAETIEHLKTGLLVTPGDPLELAESITYLIKNPRIRKRLEVTGRKAAESYSTHSFINHMEAVYKDALELYESKSKYEKN